MWLLVLYWYATPNHNKLAWVRRYRKYSSPPWSKLWWPWSLKASKNNPKYFSFMVLKFSSFSTMHFEASLSLRCISDILGRKIEVHASLVIIPLHFAFLHVRSPNFTYLFFLFKFQSQTKFARYSWLHSHTHSSGPQKLLRGLADCSLVTSHWYFVSQWASLVLNYNLANYIIKQKHFKPSVIFDAS